MLELTEEQVELLRLVSLYDPETKHELVFDAEAHARRWLDRLGIDESEVDKIFWRVRWQLDRSRASVAATGLPVDEPLVVGVCKQERLRWLAMSPEEEDAARHPGRHV